MSLKTKAAKGAVWTIAGYGGMLLIRLLSSIVLTRIFAPDIYGLMTLVWVFQLGIFLFADIGIRPSIVQSARGDDPPFVNTAWTIQIGRGIILWIVAILIAAPYAAFFGDDARLGDLIPATGVALVITGFNSTKLFTAHRHLAIRRVTIIDLFTEAVRVGVTIAYALIEPDVWAIVAGFLTGAFVKMILSHVALPGQRNRIAWEKEALHELFTFGRWIFLSTALTFLAGQSDRLVFGKIMPRDLFGVYAVANQLSTLPATAFTNLANQVAFPLYSRVHAAGEVMQPVYQKARWMIMLLGGWVLAGLASGGPTIVRLLYQEPYYDAGWIVQVLAFGAWFSVVESTNSAAILAKGHSGWNSASSIGKLVAMAVLIPLGYAHGGFFLAIVGYATSDLVKYMVSAVFARRSGLFGVRQDLAATAMVAASCAAGIAAIHALSFEGIRGAIESFAHAAHHAIPFLKPVRATAIVEAIVDFVVVSLVWAPLVLPKALRMWSARRLAGQQTPAVT
jgi:O-antigen/teichoic acid export membrane protein